MRYIILVLIIGSLFFSACATRHGHQGFINMHNNRIGKINPYESYVFEYAGQVTIGDFKKVGKGITHITKDKDGNLLYHWFIGEVLPKSGNPWMVYKDEWIGKCKYYYIVDPKTNIIKSWGFEKDSNPLSCRTWR
jgi:hypothetical protein